MKLYMCQQCANPIFFENILCEKCGSELGFLPDRQLLSALTQEQSAFIPVVDPSHTYRYCANHQHGVCNWLIQMDTPRGLCLACELNNTIPDLGNPEHLQAWRLIETAKHRLIYSLLRFRLPFESKAVASETGVGFDFLAEAPGSVDQQKVLTGHYQGRISLNIAEAEPDRREAIRMEMAEPYRSLIGHFRHEIGHYYWDRLIKFNAEKLGAARARFGDERRDYATALQSYYQNGPATDWHTEFVSAYASAHPWEDWAETWAHYFHLVDTLETAHAFGLGLRPMVDLHPELTMQADFDPYQQGDFDTIVTACVPLTLAVNSLNRGMGQPDLYPFVLSPAVLDKLRFIHGLIRQVI